MFLAQGTNSTTPSHNSSENDTMSSTHGHRRARSSSNPSDDGPRQRARPDPSETTLINPFLDTGRPDPTNDLPDPASLRVDRTPAERLAADLGVQLITTDQVETLAEVGVNSSSS
ncbi:hypothetical protein PGTUg99_009637 [Puccinia graminis f. sp. tritici]|uniref:Uncharacterized protein n=1 Tax=Puccinia graminis f. sp. tritici TaxID=56615 RepID=A0A5B0MH38_PUCGR|nr:hypothetical protein PGTUg99_009637 [Puccinia graminis f. sp. tritici]